MRTQLTVLILLLSLVMASTCYANNAGQAEIQAMKQEMDSRVQALLDSPDGVFDCEYKDGLITRFKIKASVEVGTGLQGARADRLARDKALRTARATFSKFLNNEVVTVETENETLAIVEKDKVENAEYSQVTSKNTTESSQSFQRGLALLLQHYEGEGENRTCTVIFGWSQKLVQASIDAQSSMAPPMPEVNSSQMGNAQQLQQSQQPANNRGSKTRVGDIDDF